MKINFGIKEVNAQTAFEVTGNEVIITGYAVPYDRGLLGEIRRKIIYCNADYSALLSFLYDNFGFSESCLQTLVYSNPSHFVSGAPIYYNFWRQLSYDCNGDSFFHNYNLPFVIYNFCDNYDSGCSGGGSSGGGDGGSGIGDDGDDDDEPDICSCCNSDPCACETCSTCGGVLNFEGPDCMICTCIDDVVVSITPSSQTAELGSVYNISFGYTCSNPNITLSQFSIQVIRGDNISLPLYPPDLDNPNQTINDVLDKYNNFRVLGETTYSISYNFLIEGRTYTKTASCKVLHTGASQNKIGTQFITKMTILWNLTKMYCASNPNSLIEYGMAFHQNRKTGILSEKVFTGVSTVYPNTAQIIIDIEDNLTSYTVGTFHTHPPLTYCTGTGTREVGPSDQDLSSFGWLASFVYDYSSTISCGHNINQASEIYEYGRIRIKP